MSKEKEKDEEKDDDEELEEPKKKTKKESEETPAWAKQIIKILTPTEQTEPKTIPVPKAPAKEDVQEKTQQQTTETEPKPKQSFLSWFW